MCVWGVERQPLFFITNRINCFLPHRLSISMCLGHHLFLKTLLIEYSALNFILNVALFRSVSGFNWVAHLLVISIFWSLSHAVCVQNSPPPLHSPPPRTSPLPPTSQRLLVFCCGYLDANWFNLCSDPGTWLLCFLMTVFILLTDIFKWTAARLLSHSAIIWFCRSCLTGKSLFQAKLWENSINHHLLGAGGWSKTTVKKSF